MLPPPTKVASPTPVRVVGHPSPLDELDGLQRLDVDAAGVVHVPVGVRARDDGPAELLNLLDGVDGDVPGAGDDARLAVEVVATSTEHLAGEEDGSVTGGLGTDLSASPLGALAGEDTRLVAVRDALVLPEEVADLAGADTGVAGGHVGVLPEVAIQLRHEALAEAHHLVFTAPSRIEVGAALAASDRHPGQCVLERLVEPEELDDTEVHRRVEPQATLVRTERRVELHSKAAVDLDLATIVLPGDPEDDLPLRLAQALDDLVARQLRVFASAGPSDTSTSRTVWWNSTSPGLRRRTSS